MRNSLPVQTIGIHERIQRFFERSWYVSVSLLLHMILVIAAASIVLHRYEETQADFVAGTEGVLISTDQLPPPPESVPSTPATPAFTTKQPSNAGPELDLVDTLGSSQRTVSKGVMGDLTGALDGIDILRTGNGTGGIPGAGLVGTGMRMFGLETKANSVVIVVDVSGSMISGEKSEKTYQVLEREIMKLVNDLKDVNRFGLVAFSRDARSYREHLVRASSEEKSRAVNWLKKMSPEVLRKPGVEEEEKQFHHGTRADLGLAAAFQLQPEVIFFVSDGEPTGTTALRVMGEIQERQAALRKSAVIHTIAYLADSGQHFMRSLAQENKGQFREVNPRDVK